MKTLEQILVENLGTFPFLAARADAEWTIVYERVRRSNENDEGEDGHPHLGAPVKNGYFYGVDPQSTMISLIAPDIAAWERWTTVRRSGQIRDVFDKHQETCDSCGLGNTPMRCPAAEKIRGLYFEMKNREAA